MPISPISIGRRDFRLVRIGRASLDQAQHVPAVLVLLDPEHRLVQADVVENDAAAEKTEEAL